MNAPDLAYASALELLDLYRRRALSPVEATRAVSIGSTQPSPGSTPSASSTVTARLRRRAHRRGAGSGASRWGGSTACR